MAAASWRKALRNRLHASRSHTQDRRWLTTSTAMDVAGARESGKTVSSPNNPITEVSPQAAPPLVPSSPEGLQPTLTENPPWSGWEVVALAAITLVTIFLCILVVGFAFRP